MSSQAIPVTDKSLDGDDGDGEGEEEPTDEELFDELYRLQREGDDAHPTELAVRRDGRFSIAKYRKRWGSIAKARVEARMHDDPREAVVEYLRESVRESEQIYTDSKRVADELGFEVRVIGLVLGDLEDENADETGLEFSRWSVARGRVLWEVTEA